MQCPKDKTPELTDQVLSGDLPVKECPECGGAWIPPEHYQEWRDRHFQDVSGKLPSLTDAMHYSPAPLDARAALCPDCGCFLSRARIGIQNPFYVERCPRCKGIWCDQGEWEVLEKLGLHRAIEQLFSSEWQARVREQELAERERQATIDKLGEDLAKQVFALAELLENHPNGDFGVAYLMRRFEQ